MYSVNSIRCAIAALCALCGQAVASDLAVGIKSNCTQYGMLDRMTISVALRNQSDGPVVLYSKLGWGELGGVMLRVSRINGELIHQKHLDHDMIVPSTLQEREYYSKLFENQFIGITRTEQVGEFFPGPGRYKVWAEYLSPVPAASSLIKDDFWPMEKGRIASIPVVLTVTHGEKCRFKADGS
jgi:hypothetical protein